MANKNFIIKNGITLEGYGEVIDSAGNWAGEAISSGVDSASVLSIVTADGFSKLDSAAVVAIVNPKNDVFYENSTTVNSDYTITAGKNAMSAGTILIDSGVTVTVSSGSTWTVV